MYKLDNSNRRWFTALSQWFKILITRYGIKLTDHHRIFWDQTPTYGTSCLLINVEINHQIFFHFLLTTVPICVCVRVVYPKNRTKICCPAYKKLWKITIFHGKIHYFYGDFPYSHVKLPDGNLQLMLHSHDAIWDIAPSPSSKRVFKSRAATKACLAPGGRRFRQSLSLEWFGGEIYRKTWACFPDLQKSPDVFSSKQWVPHSSTQPTNEIWMWVKMEDLGDHRY